MKQYFYAYHGPKNDKDFDYLGGYGVSLEYKQKQTKEGDFVFIVQKRPENEYYELCGLYTIKGHYYDPSSKRPYRMKLADYSGLKSRILIDDKKLGKKLPRIDGDSRWTNFQRYFCRQGVSFRSPLRTEVVKVLNELLASNGAARHSVRDLSVVEERFLDEIRRASALSDEERGKILAAASKLPSTITVTTTVFVRNPYVVAEVLKRARGICEACLKEAPFSRRSDGERYLEVHHKIRLADGGEDTVENAIALCPNCHRKMHYGM